MGWELVDGRWSMVVLSWSRSFLVCKPSATPLSERFDYKTSEEPQTDTVAITTLNWSTDLLGLASKILRMERMSCLKDTIFPVRPSG